MVGRELAESLDHAQHVCRRSELGRQAVAEQSSTDERHQSLHRERRGEHLGQFRSNTFGTDVLQQMRVVLDGFQSLDFDLKTKLGRKADSAYHAQRVLFKTIVRIADSADDAAFDVSLAADVILLSVSLAADSDVAVCLCQRSKVSGRAGIISRTETQQ